MEARSSFLRHCGPFLMHPERPLIGLRVTPEHLDSAGVTHAGLLATLADGACGAVLMRRDGVPTPPVTISFHIRYLEPVRVGDLLEAEVTVDAIGRQLAHASCLVRTGGRLVARAGAVFLQASMPPESRDASGKESAGGFTRGGDG